MNNELQEQHMMISDDSCLDDSMEWYCPTCGRRIKFELSPSYQMVVLSEGDQYAIHSGSKGGLNVGAVLTSAEEESPLSQEEKLTLVSWQEWLEKMDFESLWNKEIP